MLTLTCLKISRISHVDFPFLLLAKLWGNGVWGTRSHGLGSSFSFADESSVCTGIIWFVFVTGISTFLTTSFAFREVITALTSPCCWGELVLALCTLLRLGTGWLGNLPFSIIIAKVWTERQVIPPHFRGLNLIGFVSWSLLSSYFVIHQLCYFVAQSWSG